MPGRSYRIGRIAGIPVGVSPLWLVILALFTWSLGSDYYPERIAGIGSTGAYALGLASALLLFASILAHEFGHALVARRRGIEVQEIDLWLLGGVSRMSGEAHEPGDELRFAIAGPAVTAAIAACFGALALLLPASTPAAVTALVEYEAFVNCLLLVFNMIPAFPLDGGRVLRSLVWRRKGDLAAATDTAAAVGRGFGYLLVVLGALELVAGAPQGLWLAVIGFFVVTAAGAEARGAKIRSVLCGVPVAELMSREVVAVPAEFTVAEAARAFFVSHRYTSFPVVERSGEAVGLVTLVALESLPAERRERLQVGEIAERDPSLLVAPDADVATLLELPAFVRVGRAVVVDGARRPVGVLSITDVQRALRVSELEGSGGTPRGGDLSAGGRPRHSVG